MVHARPGRRRAAGRMGAGFAGGNKRARGVLRCWVLSATEKRSKTVADPLLSFPATDPLGGGRARRRLSRVDEHVKTAARPPTVRAADAGVQPDEIMFRFEVFLAKARPVPGPSSAIGSRASRPQSARHVLPSVAHRRLPFVLRTATRGWLVGCDYAIRSRTVLGREETHPPCSAAGHPVGLGEFSCVVFPRDELRFSSCS